jgi:hypothetical protein
MPVIGLIIRLTVQFQNPATVSPKAPMSAPLLERIVPIPLSPLADRAADSIH